MDMSNDKDMLKRKLAIYEFGCRNNFIFNVQVIGYLLSVSEKVSRNGMLFWNILVRKLKDRKEKQKKKNCGWIISVEMTDGGETCGHPIYVWKIFGCHGRSLLNFVSN